ncbi:MAG TPA: hypothetical protein VG758_07380 [Hyphomicrobiaceae bacterium]|jgi:hypothetical protein|nr:hypothetical protein [Hyphomicrobiaceae bacterium]
MRVPLALLVSAAIPVAGSLLAPTADAGSRRSHQEPKSGYVTAESRYGYGSITGPVRVSAQGRREVRLPGGTWIECRRSCANTLRQETVDFWYIRTNVNSSGDDGPGYLSFQFRW